MKRSNKYREVAKAWSNEHPLLARVFGIAVVAMVIVVFAWWFVEPRNAAQRMTFIQTVGTLGGGAALLAGLYFTARNLQVNREGQITERFTRAIDQLGSEKLEIRLGGIYALERIANDSPERDYSTIIEVLTTSVRENARRQPEETLPSSVKSNEDEEAPTESDKQEPPRPPADIQAILTVLGRRKKGGAEDDMVLDLSATDLRGANLRGAKRLRG